LSKALIRNQILGIRTTNDFIKKFDSLCDRLGYNRSEIIRYALKRFYNEHFNNPEGFSKVRKDLY
jgi:metal-responsive CopG/Arc/MetJ family transcriptional regulator